MGSSTAPARKRWGNPERATSYLHQPPADQIRSLGSASPRNSARAKRRKEAEAVKAKLERVSCSIAKKVGEQDKLFGSVTSQDIEKAFATEGFAIDKKDILLAEPIKALGVYSVPVRVFDDVVANTKIWVVRE